MKTLAPILITLILALPAVAQIPQLEEYVELGLQSNLNIEQNRIMVEQSFKDLDMAKGSLLPSLDFNTRYSKATGGRTSVFPVGDLMNPVYSTLNDLLGENTFPQIENQVLEFNRPTDVNTAISLSQPLYDRRLWLNKKIAEEITKGDLEGLNKVRREMVMEIKNGYFNYLKTVKVLELLEFTRETVVENLRVAESLKANDKVTQDVVWRAQSDLSAIDYQIADARKNERVAQSYFNFLLNRPLTTSIITAELKDKIPSIDPETINPSQREEWRQLDYGMEAVELQGKLANSQNLPNLYAAVDYGFQGTKYEFNSEADYTLTSLVVKWNLFNGWQNKAERQKLELERKRLQTRQKELGLSIEFEQVTALYEYQAATSNRTSAAARERDATETYRLIDRKFKEGLSTQVELIDARNNMTKASLQRIIAHYDLWVAFASYERAVAAYQIDNTY